MRFEEALEAMRKGKKIRRKEWEKKYIVKDESLRIGVANSDTGDMLGLEAILCGSDILADDWEVASNKSPIISIDGGTIKKLSQEMFTKVPIEPGVMYQLESEDKTMYKNLEITFKSGETITYKPGEWDDYAYDGGAVIVKHDGAWVGIYNFDHVFCVELKK